MATALCMCVCVREREREGDRPWYIWGVASSSSKSLTVALDSFCHYCITS